MNIDTITDIRGFNRFYTNILGLLDRHILDSGYTLAEARVIFEINRVEHCTVKKLSVALDMDIGYISRIITKFVKLGIVEKETRKTDARVSEIVFTDKGLEVFHDLDRRSNEQIENMFSKLNESDCKSVCDAMNVIKKHLTLASTDIAIRPYREEDVEYVIDRQLSLYESERNFTSEIWKKYLINGVLSLVNQFDSSKDSMFILDNNGKQSGCIAITHTEENTAQLRYFFLEPELRGLGAGKRLLKMAIDFSREKGYSHLFLWTVSAQETARRLYSKVGFVITETAENTEWGVPVLEERWDMDL